MEILCSLARIKCIIYKNSRIRLLKKHDIIFIKNTTLKKGVGFPQMHTNLQVWLTLSSFLLVRLPLFVQTWMFWENTAVENYMFPHRYLFLIPFSSNHNLDALEQTTLSGTSHEASLYKQNIIKMLLGSMKKSEICGWFSY